MLNLLFRASESYNDMQRKLVRKLADSSNINKLIVISRSNDIPQDTKSIIEYKSEIGWTYQYRFTKEYKESEPLSRNILEKIRPFLSTAMMIASRDTNYDIYSVNESRNLVYISLRYWNQVILSNKVNYMIFSYLPHTLHEYSIYILGRIYGIPMQVYSSTHIPHVFVWGDSIENVGDNIKYSFDSKNRDIAINNIYINNFLAKIRECDTNSKKNYFEIRKARNRIKIELDRFIKPYNIALHYYSRIISKSDLSYVFFYEKKYIRDLLRSIKLYFIQKRVGYYERKAVNPDYSRPYIYFGLQLTPEATTLPMAGVFDEQLLSIKILAKAAKSLGVKIYVKEHYVQPRRDRYFYKELMKIDNVVCIKSNISSMELIKNAVAVSTQTGSCIIEGFIKHKHSLVFGDCYYWKGMPGLHVISDVQQCRNTIIEILRDDVDYLTDEIVDSYFASIDKNSIIYEAYMTDLTENEKKEMNIDKMVESTYKTYMSNIMTDTEIMKG